MEEEKKKCENCGNKFKCKPSAGAGGCVYGLGFIGALFYFIGNATTFWVGVLGFFKALVWPAIIIYKLLDFLK